MSTAYRTVPTPTTGLPSGIGYIIGNEAAERFSFYGMRAILVVFMTEHLLGRDGSLEVMSDAQATAAYHTFSTAVYLFPLLGSILADTLLGKYRTIMMLSIVYCLGHAALAIDETRIGLTTGLFLIALGSGGIKPCVSAHVGDQFGRLNQHLLPKVYAWFYFSINFGSFISTLLTPVLLEKEGFGPAWAFGVPGVLMAIATFVFWMGRHKFVHVPPAGQSALREALSPHGRSAIMNLVPLYLIVAVFWALYDQTGSSWVLQLKNMNLDVVDLEGNTRTLLPSQVQAINPILILLFIPLFSYVIYPAIDRFFPLTPLRKIGIGFFLAAAAFAVVSIVEEWITAGHTPYFLWQVLAFVLITAAEVMISITALEFAYTQAPTTMKSFIMSFYLLSMAVGNAFTAGINMVIQTDQGVSRLQGPAYYWFFTGLMLFTALFFPLFARFYRGMTYIQGEDEYLDD
ncbi:MAG: POT family MFS transporter [Pirellulales bacterium]